MSDRIIIKNGHVIDPANHIDRVCDIEISDGKIYSIGEAGLCSNAVTIYADGKYVVPGLIDFHTHLFEGGSQFGFNADMLTPYGVTTCVDAGTAGSANYSCFHRNLVQKLPQIYTFLNISSMGQMGSGLNENLNPDLVDEGAIRELISQYPEEIRGIKIRISKSIVGAQGIAPLRKALEVSENLGLPVCVHSTDPCIPMEELADMLRPGDVLCHLYHGSGSTILNEDGAVKPEVIHAAQRGVWMDAANGRTNFSFSVAKRAIEQGFLPGIISTDLTAATVSRGKMVRNLLFIMSKYLNLGLSLEKIVACVTEAPAQALGIENERGTLAIGTTADAAILDVIDQDCEFLDSHGCAFPGTKMISNLMTIQSGKIVFDSNQLKQG